MGKESYLVLLYEESESFDGKLPCEYLGVFSTYKNAEKAMLKDADELIEGLKSEGYKFSYNNPDEEGSYECCYPTLIVQEDLSFLPEDYKKEGSIFYYNIIYQELDVEPIERSIILD